MLEDAKMKFITFIMSLFDRDSWEEIPFIFKAIIFLSIALEISFWFSLFSGYRPIIAIFEVVFYLLTGGVSILTCIILLVLEYSMKGIQKTLFYCFMIPTIVLSMLLACLTWLEDVTYDDAIYNLPPQCEIVSPDGQKTLVIKYRIPSDSFVDIWVHYNFLPFLGRELEHFTQGDFCDAVWLDNNKVLTFDFSTGDRNEKVIEEIGFFEFRWAGLMKFSAFYALLILCIELLKRVPRFLRWFPATVLKRPKK
jgi:hypothetical protein